MAGSLAGKMSNVVSLGVVANSLSRRAGGLLASMCETGIELLKDGVDVHAYGISDEFTALDAPMWSPVELSHFRTVGLKRFGYAPGLARAVTGAGHDVIHQHGLWTHASLVVNVWRRKTGRPTVISSHGMLDPWALKNSVWKKRAARLLFEDRNLARASCLHALNTQEAESIRALGLSNPIAVIPNGVRLPVSTVTVAPPAWMEEDSRKVLLFLGRIHPKKGVDRLLEAWALLKRDNRELGTGWVLAIAGWDDGGHLNPLSSTRHRLGLDDNGRVLGPLFGEEKDRLLRHARAFVLPSLSEGLPITILEAWSYGLPVFMTAECNLPRGFDVNAAFEITADPRDIASSFSAHLSDERSLRSVGESGRALVAREFSWQAVAAEFALVYRWLLGDGARPASIQ